MTVEFDITPMGYKRMTRYSKWNKQFAPYYAWRDVIRYQASLMRFELPDSFEVDFFIPMPKSWSNRKREAMRGKPHQQKPDRSNLEKALEDALREDDSGIWNVHGRKFWADAGSIVIRCP